MNKTKLIKQIHKSTGITKLQAKQVIESFQHCVVSALLNGEKVIINGFGVFSIINRTVVKEINQTNDEKIQTETKRVVKFKEGMLLNAMINK